MNLLVICMNGLTNDNDDEVGYNNKTPKHLQYKSNIIISCIES